MCDARIPVLIYAAELLPETFDMFLTSLELERK